VKYKADLHIHTVLSPCGDIEMSPVKIIDAAMSKGLNIIGITDHNSTLNAIVTAKLGEKAGIFVMCGAEITTREEVHCLCFMPNYEGLQHFQSFINSSTIFFPNNPEKFGFSWWLTKKKILLKKFLVFLLILWIVA
jgi:PHP family Zn ribbon phosphoesterase